MGMISAFEEVLGGVVFIGRRFCSVRALAVLLLQRFKWRRESRFLSFLFTGYYLLSAVVFGFDYAQSLHVQEVGRRPAALW